MPKILIVDDEEDIRLTVMSYLKELDYETLTAKDGKMAVEIAKIEKPDLIVMDWQMPDVTGIEAAKSLSQLDETKTIPVIIMTGMMLEIENLETALNLGAVDFLRKPLDKREFVARVKACLRTKSQNQLMVELIKDERNLIEQTLAFKDRELASKTMFDYQRDEMLSKLLEQVGRLDRITNYLYATDIKQIEKELKNQLNLEKKWNEFKMYFEEVHPGFFDQLIAKYNSLTQHDCKLCALIRMGLDNTEIANFTNIARSSADRALNRLKKKLQLSEKDSLRDFVISMS